MLARFKKALKILIRGEEIQRKRGPIPAITEQELAELRQFFPREKFFIYGHARSGTTLLARLIRLHPEIHCNWQAHFFTRQPFLTSLVDSPEIQEWLTRRSNRWNQAKDLSAFILRGAADLILEREALLAGKRIVGDKSPSSLIHGQAIRDTSLIYPDARIIYIIRDGRDVLISERFRNFVEDSKFLNTQDKSIIADLKVNQTQFTDGSRSIFTDSFISRAAKGWVDNVTETVTEGKRIYGDRFHLLRYEDLLREPFAEMSSLWKSFGVEVDSALEQAIIAEAAENPDEQWQAQKNDSIASFLPKGKVGNWKNMFTKADQALFKSIAGKTLIEWGYEKDLDW
ncbi:MAG TPA: sulfotransferase [Anaerolineales bacterium]|nr:sulfotransferase [Anaerolineales bacterium]